MIKKYLVIALCAISVLTSAQALLPQPNNIHWKAGNFQITQKTAFKLESNSKDLEQYTQSFTERLQHFSGIFLESTFFSDTISNNLIKITIENSIDSLYFGMDESYTLNIENNKIELKAPTNVGAYRGLETLLQLIQKNNNGAYIPSCEISDAPKYPWRGLMIDVCRHWIPAEVIKRNIDAMASVKMNVLHLHLTDDQGFRIESKLFPKLHEKGSNGHYFSQNEMKEIVEYAKKRGIRVIPEFDIPGHATSWLVGYPELGAVDRDYKIETNYGIFDASLNPAEEQTYEFLNEFIGEMTAIFPDAYIHIGGDENNGKDWDANKKIQRFKKSNGFADNHDLQAYFNQKVYEILKNNNRKMIGWDEIFNTNLPNDIVIQSWRGKNSLYECAEQGYGGILSNGFYLDKAFELERYYSNNPLPDSLSSKYGSKIYGGEATMWTELVNQRNIESRIWPATLAIAERLWSDDNNCDFGLFLAKYQIINNRLEEFGLLHQSFQTSLLKQQLANNNVADILPIIRTLEPLKGYKRHQFLKYKTHYPLNRLVDACLTNSTSALEFNKNINNYCKKGYCTNKQSLLNQLVVWAKSSEDYLRICPKSSSLSEAKGMIINIQELCEISWIYINSPSEITEKQKERAQNLINEIENFKLDVSFAPLKGFKKLYNL